MVQLKDDSTNFRLFVSNVYGVVFYERPTVKRTEIRLSIQIQIHIFMYQVMQYTKTLLNLKMTLSKSKKNADYSFLQEAAKESKAALLSPDDAEDAESPLPSNIISDLKVHCRILKSTIIH